MRLLLIEDDTRLANLIVARLVDAGFAVDHEATAEAAQLALQICPYALVILDLGLPDADGLDIIAGMRHRGDGSPVLVLTSRSTIDERVAGLEAGADDYLLKPFAFGELKARIDALLRRPGAIFGLTSSVGNLGFDHSARQATIAGRPIVLSARELQMLEVLVRRPGYVVQRHVLESQLYGLSDPIGSNALDVAVFRLRKRLESHGATIEIHTVRGVGFMLSSCS